MRSRTRFFSLIGPVLFVVMGAQAMQPFHLPSRTRALSEVRSAAVPGVIRIPPAAEFAPGGPTVSQLQKAFPGRSLLQVGPVEFQSLIAAHSGRGRLLTGPALAVAMSAGSEAPAGNAPEAIPGTSPEATPGTDSAETAFEGPRALREYQARAKARRDSLYCDSLWRKGDTEAYWSACSGDSLARGAVGEEALPGAGRNAMPLEAVEADAADNTGFEEARVQGYLGNLMVDVSNSGPGSIEDDGPWAAIFFVVIGVVVVGAFIFYGAHTLYELAVNKADYPVYLEAGARFSHSGKAWRDGAGADLYRNANLAGMRFAVGLERPGMGLGLSLEAGYIDVALRGLDNPSRTFGFNGGYFMAGPMLRFGRNEPYSFSLEFLNGTSNHASIGWISKSRMTLARKFGSHFLLGAHLGGVFYELEFLDGLAWRRGSLNRDLSLVYGLDSGWDF